MRERTEVGRNIIRLCKAHDMSLIELAEALSISYKSATNMLTSDKYVTLERLKVMCAIFDCTISDLIDANGLNRPLAFSSSHMSYYPWTVIRAAIKIDPEGLDIYKLYFPAAKECFDLLTKKEKHVLLRLFRDHKSAKEIATETFSNDGAVRKLAQAALQKLNDLLRERCVMVLKKEKNHD